MCDEKQRRNDAVWKGGRAQAMRQRDVKKMKRRRQNGRKRVRDAQEGRRQEQKEIQRNAKRSTLEVHSGWDEGR